MPPGGIVTVIAATDWSWWARCSSPIRLGVEPGPTSAAPGPVGVW